MQDQRYAQQEPSMTGLIGDLEDYVQVAERVEAFYQDYPNGRIIPTLIEHHREDGFVMMKAEVYRNPDDVMPASTGHAYEYRDTGEVNRTSYIENCETSAVGRALAMMGYCVKRGIASREEMEKVQRHSPQAEPVPDRRPPAPFYEWTENRNKKLVLMLKPDQNVPERVDCPNHRGKVLTLRSNNNGQWLSHRQEDGYCSADIRYQPRPQASAADLRGQLAEHNRNGRTAN